MDDSPRGTGRYGEKEKIPRPRNAFILFRQHHHKLLIDEWTAQGVEIPHNSKISKLLGVKWKELSGEEKTHWKALAEKEKTDHEKRYPDYRYKPVRKQRKKREPAQPAAAALAAPPPAPVQPQHLAVGHRPPQGLLPFNNYTRPAVGDLHGASAYYLPKAAGQATPMPQYYVQQPYTYNYYAKTTSAPAAQPVYPTPIPLQMQMQMQAQHRGYQHHQHRIWNGQQSAGSSQNPQLHPIISSTSIFHDFPNTLNPGSNPSPDSNSH